MKKRQFTVLTLLLFIVLLNVRAQQTFVSPSLQKSTTTTHKPVSPLREVLLEKLKTKDKIKLDLFVMSQCPFGVRAEETLLPLVSELGERVEFKLHFVGWLDQNQRIESMHGQTEVDENFRQVVIAKLYPALLARYLLARAKNYQSNDWKSVAQPLGILSEVVEETMASAEGQQWLLEAIRPSMEQKIYASPTVLLDGEKYRGRIMPLSTTGAANEAQCNTPPSTAAKTADAQCSGKPDGSSCNDGNPCTQTDACESGVCIGKNPKTCDDSNACTTDVCDRATGACVNSPKVCSDNSECTVDACNPANGQCVYTVLQCDDNNPNTMWAGCDASTGCYYNISCQAYPNNIAYVNAAAMGSNLGNSWANAFTDLQNALFAAKNCGVTQIWVAAGTYKPTADPSGNTSPADPRTKTFMMVNGVAIYGGFNGTETELTARNWRSNPTILSGDIGNSGVDTDNSYRVINNTFTSGSRLNNTAILDGFIVEKGYANGNFPLSLGGGMWNSYASPKVQNCVFRNNYAAAGGGMFNDNSSSSITNCLFLSNTVTTAGAGISNGGGTDMAKVINCTFYGNTGSTTIANERPATSVSNSIIWGNGGGISGGMVSFSIVQGGFIGMNNFNIDPRFVNAAGGDFRVQQYSPAIDAGTNTDAPITDFEGNARPFNATGINKADMGAYEYQSTYDFCATYDNTTGEVLNISTTVSNRLANVSVWRACGLSKVRITAKGAVGGPGGNSEEVPGGAGATMIGEFILLSGQILQAVAGAPGSRQGGGGGSGVQISGGNLLILAGAGGGGAFGGSVGKPGQITTGSGNGGSGNEDIGGGGGGFYSGGGGNNYQGSFSGGGGGFAAKGGFFSLNGFFGGGGFGAGGAPFYGGSGGGGGYDGGNGTGFGTGANGGGSYNIGSNQNNTAGANNAGGQVIIEYLGTATYSATVTPTQPTCTQSGSISIDFTGDFNNNTSGGLEYAIVAGNSFTGTPTFSDVTADPLNVTLGVGTMVGAYTVRIRLKYNPTVYVDKNYTLTRPCNCTFYVNANATGANNGSSWADAFTSLQDALAMACSGAQIWVAAGTYKPTADPSGNTSPANPRTKTFVMKNGVAIYGGFSGTETELTARNWRTNATILSGDIGNSGVDTDNSYRVINNTFTSGSPLDNTAILDGFIVEKGYANGSFPLSLGGGMWNAYASPKIQNCVFRNNFAAAGGGMFNDNSSSNITNCLFLNNTVTTAGAGISNGGGTDMVKVINCTFYGNAGPTTIANERPATSISNSIIWGNGGGISRGTVTYCDVQGGFSGTGNIDIDPRFVNAAGGDFSLQQCSPGVDAGTNTNAPASDFAGNARPFNATGVSNADMGAYEYQATYDVCSACANTTTGILYVNASVSGGSNNGSSWTNAFRDLQSALTLARTYPSCVSQIWVAKGTYKPTSGSDRGISFSMVNGVAMYGGFVGTETQLSARNWVINETILSGDIDSTPDIVTGSGMTLSITGNDGNSYHVIYNDNNGLTASSILNGFTISGGNASANASPNNSGGGMYINNASPSIVNCKFIHNNASNRGGGAYFNNSNTTLENCNFNLNSSGGDGGGVYLLSGSLAFISCQVNGNSAVNGFGGGIHSRDVLTISSSQLNNNAGVNAGGISHVNRALAMTNCEIKNNTAVFQGAAGNFQNVPTATLTNCVINGNSSQKSQGGIAIIATLALNSQATLINCTVGNNTSVDGYKAIWATKTTNDATAKVILKNTIVSNNPGGNFSTVDVPLTPVYFGTIQSQGNNLDSDGSSGFTNGANGDLINVDPLFISPTDFRLQPCSPAINAGDPATTSATVGNVDLGENPRFYNNGRIDMGAYEYQATPPAAITPIVSSSNPTTCGGVEGSITLSGFLNNTVYSVTYKKNSVAVSAANFTSNGSGVITLTGLGAGNYTEIVATYGACVSNAVTSSLEDPVPPTVTIASNNSPICSGNNATFSVSGTTGATLTYTLTGLTGNQTLLLDGTNQTILANNATSDVTLTLESVTKNSCLVSLNATSTVTVNPLPTATIVSSNSPICSGNNATFSVNGTNGATLTYTLTGLTGNQTLLLDGTNQAILANNATADVTLTLVSVTKNNCLVSLNATSTVAVNPLPTATIASSNSPICSGNNATFSVNGTTGATLTYTLTGLMGNQTLLLDGTTQTILANNATSDVTLTLVSVTKNNCFVSLNATSTVTVNPLPTATIGGTTTVCQNATSPKITFTGAGGATPYTFTYKINNGSEQTIVTTSGNSVSLDAPTGQVGIIEYSLVRVKDGSSTLCSQTIQTGGVTVTVQGKPTITLTTLQQILNEGNSQVLCDTDANPVNSLQFTVSGSCVTGSPVWRAQVGSGSWSNWSPNAPISQSSNNQPHRYQAACDASCPVTYTNPIELTINYRSTVPQNVSMLVDGVTVAVGETKEVCSLVNMPLTFTTNCGANEVVVYSVDGGEYSAGVPVGLVDNQYHNYRVRCRQSGGTVSCVESESGVMRLKLVVIPSAPTVSLSSTSSCNPSASFSGQSSCGSLRTVWYNATTNIALPSLLAIVPSQTTSYYARCQTENGCVSEKSNVVTFTLTPTQVAPIITASQEIVCTGMTVRISANCPAGSQTFWNTGITASSFEVSFSNVTKQTYWAKCLFEGGCQSAESVRKDVYWNAFVVTLINIGESKSAVKVNDRSAWSSQFITRDGGPELEQSTQVNPTLYYVENANKAAPRYWTINVEACGLSTDGSLTFDMLATPEMGVIRSFNTHENNAPYFMYANREGWTELYAQNHPAYGFYQDNGAGGNSYDAGLPKGLYKLGIRYWDQKGWGSIYPSTRKPQGNVLAYQEYWFRIQSKDGVGVGAARTAEQVASRQGARGEGQGASVQEARGEGQSAFANVMPNPVTHTLRLKVQESKGQVVQAALTDAVGREVLSRQFVPETNTHQEEFGVSALPTGMYFLKVSTSEKQATLKVVKVE